MTDRRQGSACAANAARAAPRSQVAEDLPRPAAESGGLPAERVHQTAPGPIPCVAGVLPIVTDELPLSFMDGPRSRAAYVVLRIGSSMPFRTSSLLKLGRAPGVYLTD
jgi:hypothetical protein